MAAELGERDLSKPLIIIVHGVGNQLRLETLRYFIRGWCQTHGLTFSKTRAQIAEQIREGMVANLDDIPFAFAEFNYADLIKQHENIAEADPQKWLRSFRHRLVELNVENNGPLDELFTPIDCVVDDISLASTLVKFVAERLKLGTATFDTATNHFLRQVQLYIDHEPYRRDVTNEFSEFMGRLENQTKDLYPKKIIAAHSLGTVVTFQSLLNAAATRQEWPKAISRYITFGSPIDLFMVLFYEQFERPAAADLNLRWTNYSFGNDPIASDLLIARQWIDTCPGLFAADAPVEVTLGSGTIQNAHNDYWSSPAMMHDIAIDLSKTPDEGPAGNARQKAAGRVRTTRAFFGLSALACSIAAWLMVVWWEENLKGTDADRVTSLEPAWIQVSSWLLFVLAVMTHVCAWSMGKIDRVLSAVLCLCFSIALCIYLPLIPILGVEPYLVGKDIYALPVFNHVSGNAVLLFIPLSAFLGCTVSMYSKNRDSLRKKNLVLLSCATIALTFLVGRRDNPSNATSEFAILSLIFAVWWLAVLLARIDRAYAVFIGDRKHLDYLASLWRVPVADPAFFLPYRTLRTAGEVSDEPRPTNEGVDGSGDKKN